MYGTMEQLRLVIHRAKRVYMLEAHETVFFSFRLAFCFPALFANLRMEM